MQILRLRPCIELHDLHARMGLGGLMALVDDEEGQSREGHVLGAFLQKVEQDLMGAHNHLVLPKNGLPL